MHIYKKCVNNVIGSLMCIIDTEESFTKKKFS